jgi:hypothetical protein
LEYVVEFSMASVQHRTLIAGLKEFHFQFDILWAWDFRVAEKGKNRFPSLFQSVGCTGGEMGVVTKLNQCLNSSRSSPCPENKLGHSFIAW